MQRIIDGTLMCTTCEQRQTLDNFSKNVRSLTGLDYICRECRRIRHHAWMAALTPEARERHRVRTQELRLAAKLARE